MKVKIISLKKLVAMLCIFSIFLVGCQKTSSSNEDKSVEAEKTKSEITVTDICGRKVTLDKPAERVILTFNFEEYFATTGENGLSKVVGWSRKYWEVRRQSTWDAFYEKFPKIDKIQDVGYIPKGTFNVETAISLKPDVIIMAKNDFDKVSTELERLEQANIPVVFVDYHKQTMKNHTDSTMLIGKVMGEEKRAEELVSFYKKQMAVVSDKLKDLDIKRPKVYVEFSDADGPKTFGSTYGTKMWGAIIQQCGGDNIAKDLVKGASAPINPEQILSANPDIIIFAGNQFENNDINIGLGYTSDKETAIKNIDKYKQRTGWENLNAVKNGQVYAIYHDLSRHIFDFAGIQFFAKTIHPELFEDLEPESNLKEFHDKFYPIDYKGTWTIGIEE